MKTVPFSNILTPTCQLIGLDVSTLNEKSFATIRDLATRRVSQIWDREDWPDTQRTLRTFPGSPVSSVLVDPQELQTEDYQDLVCENLDTLWWQNSENTLFLYVYLDSDFPRIYLSDFEDNAYRRKTITETNVSFLNPFFLLLEDGARQSIDKQSYKFTWIERSGEENKGPYIYAIRIEIPYSTPEYDYPYTQPNNALTTTVVFDKNRQLIVQLDGTLLQGLEVFNADPRLTSRCRPENFFVEEFDNINDMPSDGSYFSQTNSYIRVFDSNEKFIKLRLDPPTLFGQKWSELKQYPASGSQVYYSGLFWNAISQDIPTGVAPSGMSRYWAAVDIPYRFRDFLVNGIAADFLRSEGRADEAGVLDNLAEASIQQQIDVLVRQQGQVRKLDMAYTY